MRLEFFFMVGIFFNLVLSIIFPYQLLPENLQEQIGTENLVYNYLADDSNLNSQEFRGNTNSMYNTFRNEENFQSLTDVETQSTLSDQVASFFDAVADTTRKIATVLSFFIPFSKMLVLLPGVLGLIIGTMYGAIMFLAVLNWIKNRG